MEAWNEFIRAGHKFVKNTFLWTCTVPLLKASRVEKRSIRRYNRSKAAPPGVGSIAADVYKSTIYSPRSEFVIILMISTQIRIYRVDIEDSASLEARGLHRGWTFIAFIKIPLPKPLEYFHPPLLFPTPADPLAAGGDLYNHVIML